MTQRYEKYKDSGVQWLGEIPEHWDTIKLGRVFSFIGGNAFNSDNYSNEDTKYQLIRIGNVKNDKLRLDSSPIFISSVEAAKSEKAKLRKGCILFTMTGTKGKRDYFYTLLLKEEDFQGRELYLNQRVGCLTPRTIKIDVKYYNYLLKDPHILDSIFIHETGTANQGNLGIESISRTKLHFPPLPEQQAIVSYLDTKCEKIDEWLAKKQKEVVHLQELKQRIIADAVTRGLNPEVKMKETNIPWLPEVPVHWEIKRLASLFTNDIQTNKDFIFKRAFKFNYGSLVTKNEAGDLEEYRDVYMKYSIVQKGDIVINGLNLNYDFVSQRVACAESDGIITSAYEICRPRRDVNYSFFTLLFKAMDNMKLFHGMGTGIRLTLSFGELKKQMLPVPPKEEQHQIVSYIIEKTSKIDTLITNINKEIENIKEYKQRLISDVVTGQIKVC